MIEIYEVYYGAILILTVQCIIVAGFNLAGSNSRNKWFAIFVLLISHSAIRSTLSWPFDDTELYWWITVLNSAQFYGPVLYLFLLSHIEEVERRAIVLHFSIPIIFFVTLVILGFNPQFREYSFYPHFSSFLNAILVFLLVGYTIAGIHRIRTDKWDKILHTVSIKSRLFFLLVGVYLCYAGFYLMINTFFKSLVGEKTLTLIGLIDMALYFILLLALPFYGFSILPWFKKIIQPANISIQTDQDIATIIDKIDQFFAQKELHKDSDLTVNKLASLLRIPSKDLTLILKNEYQKSFTEFLNHVRVEALKKDLKNPSLENYDLTSLAKEHGFNSKSTFFRVFKNYTGMTPNEFKAS